MTFTTAYPEHFAIPQATMMAPQNSPLSLQDGQALVECARATLLQQLGLKQKTSPSKLPQLPIPPIHLRFRCRGAYWSEGISIANKAQQGIDQAVTRALQLRKAARSDMPLLSPDNIAEELGVEVTLFYSPQKINERSFQELQKYFGNASYGAGLEVNGQLALIPNSNWQLYKGSLSTFLKQLSSSCCTDELKYQNSDNALWCFKTLHWVSQKPDSDTFFLEQCDNKTDISKVTANALDRFLESMGQCLLRWVQHDGRMAYRFEPVKGRWSSDNNILRQWMATHALAELYNWKGQEDYRNAWKKNAGYNLGKSYYEQKGYGFIVHNKTAKLGAAASAALALTHGAHDGEFITVEKKLIKALWHQRQSDGMFRTFFIPEDRNDQQSFYSGEALLAIAIDLADQGASQEQLTAIRKTKAAYQNYFIDSQCYAPFIPWHTMAYWWMYKVSGEQHYVDSIFELNDFLLCLQDLDHDSHSIDRGRFFREETRFHGVDHSSSTAIYVEGLCYAYDCAKQQGDETRQQAYLQAIRWGLRSLIQLQFTEENTFYIYHKELILGGIKTTATNPVVRCDNTQHAIMAVLAALKFIPNQHWQIDLPLANDFREQQLSKFRKKSWNNNDDDSRSHIILAGDVQLSRYTQLWCEKRGYDYPFKAISNLLQESDLLACNLECVVATHGEEVKKRGRKVYHFRAAPEMLSVFPKNLPIYMSLANNHTMDYGPDALNEMIEKHLPDHNLAFAGAGKNQQQASSAKVMDVKGTRIAFYSFTTIEPEFSATEDSSGYNYIDINDDTTAKNIFQQILNKTDADLHIISIHWGTNHNENISDAEINLAHSAIDAGMSAVIGHHSHLLRGMEIYKGAPIFYDLGNFLVDFKFYGWDDQSMLVKLVIQNKKLQRVELTPICVHNKKIELLEPHKAQSLLQRFEKLSAAFDLPLLSLDTQGIVHLERVDNEESQHVQ